MAEFAAVEQAPQALQEATIRSLTAEIVELMETKCIRFNGQAPNWRALFGEEFGRLSGPESPAAFELRVNRALTRGGLSHVAFFHESAQSAPARYAVNASFIAFDTPEGPRWMFQDVHEGGPAHLAGARPGDLLLTVDGAASRPPSLPTFGLGTDPVLTVLDAKGEIRQLQIVLPKAPADGKPHAKPPMAEPTSVTSRWLDQGLGYLHVAFFPGANGQRFAQDLDRALATLPGCTKLIIDLRGNLGGFVGSLRLMSYLTPERIPVGYSLTKHGEDQKWRPEQLPTIDKLPTSALDMAMMAVRFKILNKDRSIRLVTEGLGPKPFHGRIAMLINEHTLSAGEMVAAFAAENNLATLIGARTGGQVLGGANFTVGHGFILRLPAAGWYTPNGAVVEGKGVPPHIDLPLSLPELRRGVDNQLVAAMEALSNR